MSVKTVFLSSTARDLAEYREAVTEAINGLDDYKCVRMEDFGARDWAADDFCRAKVAECDLFVGVVGHLYGSCPEGSEQSYTEREYKAAIATGLPRLMFIAPEDFTLPVNLREPEDKWQRQRAFRERVSQARIRDTFTSPDDLARRVVQAIRNWEQEQAAQERRLLAPRAEEMMPHPPERERAGLRRSVVVFLVFLAFIFVLLAVTVGLGEQDLSSSRVCVIIAGMAGLLLLLGMDRLTALRVSPIGVEATLTQVQAQALGEIDEIEDQEAAEAARAQILQAESPAQVQAAMAMATELNVNRVMERVKQAIHQKRKVYVRYCPDPQGPVETYQVACLDVKPGKTPATRANDYLWAYSYKHEGVISLRLGRVLGVELSEETFDPAEVMAEWKQKEPEWNVSRDWS